jgi:hypothetical protein
VAINVYCCAGTSHSLLRQRPSRCCRRD